MTKSIKFHTDENFSKKEETISFLKECQYVANILISWKFDSPLESYKYAFINHTKFYNQYFKLRSHHFQQIQEQVFNIIQQRYLKIIEKLKFENKFLNYLKYFVNNWSEVEDYIQRRFDKTNDNFYNEVFDYWNKNKDLVKETITKKFFENVRKSKVPKLENPSIKVDLRSSKLDKSTSSKYFKYWFDIFTNQRLNSIKKQRGRWKKISIPIKFSKYHKRKLKGNKLNNSFILKYDTIYERLEIVTSYEEINSRKKNISKVTKQNSIGIDLGYINLITTSEKEIIPNNEKLKKDLNQFLTYEKQVKRLEIKNNYDSKKYLKKQKKLSNQSINFINFQLNQLVTKYPTKEHFILEDLSIHESSFFNKKYNYLLRRLGVQGTINKFKQKSEDLGIKVHLINPAYTSQQCSICSYTNKENRKTQDEFICQKCGHHDHADINAAINIKERFFNIDLKSAKYIGEIRKVLNKLFEIHQVAHNATSQLSTSPTG